MDDQQIRELALAIDDEHLVREGAPQDHPEFNRLVRTIWRLRQSDGCPWDKVQTHESIAKNTVEEAYEVAEAIYEDQTEHLCEELGDLLEQVLLHAQIAADAGEFSIDEICCGLNEKLVRRHPHVFGDAVALGAVDSVGAVLDIWDDVKREERSAAADEPGLLDSVPKALPALMQAQKISKRAVKVGFEWESVADIWDKVAEERAEFEAEPRGSEAAAEEFGDMLFALVNVARREGIDAEEALAASNRKFRRRWAIMEEMARAEGVALEDLSTVRLNELWDEAKRR